MNVNQRRVLILGLLCVLLMVLVPPWKYSIAEHRDIRYDWLVYDVSLGYGFVLLPPHLHRDAGQLRAHFARFVRLDSARLLVQSMVVVSLIGVLLIVMADPQRTEVPEVPEVVSEP